MENLSNEQRQEHWAKTKQLMLTVMAIWVVFSFIIHMFVETLNEVSFLSFPLGFWMAGQGSLIVFVITIFWFAKKQNEIDENFGVSEE